MLEHIAQADSPREFLSRKWLEIRRHDGGWTWYPVGRFAQRPPENARQPRLDRLDEMIGQLPRNQPAVLCLPASQCFVRRFAIGKSFLPRLHELAAMDLQRISPFPPEAAFSGTRVVTNGPVCEVEQIAVHREDVSQAVSQLKAHGIVVDAITFRGDDGSWLPVVLAPDGRPYASESHRRWRGALAASFATAIAAAGLLALAVSSNGATRLAQIEAASAALKPQIESVKSRLAAYRETSNAYREIEDWRLARGSVLNALEELSKQLPDTTYLAGFAHQDRKISIDGFSKEAEKLISVLENSEAFSGVSFASPVYRDAGEEYSRISITMTGQQAGGAAP